MGAVRLIYDETLRQMKRLGRMGRLSIAGTRDVMASHLRYCLQNDTLYLPEDESLVEQKHRLCWGRIRVEYAEEYPWMFDFDRDVPEDPLKYHMPFTGIGFGATYSRRHRETSSGRRAVDTFVAQEIIDIIAKDPEELARLGKRQFEEFAAEIFARRGFEVDLFRMSKDDGIDFLAVRNEDTLEPLIFAVQTKHPDILADRKRKSLPVATVREIYGVAKAWNLRGGIAITSTVYSREARKFAERKPDEIQLVNAEDLIEWARKYRWNRDE